MVKVVVGKLRIANYELEVSVLFSSRSETEPNQTEYKETKLDETRRDEKKVTETATMTTILLNRIYFLLSQPSLKVQH